MSELSKEISCIEHGISYATFVCQHLATGSGLGFYCSGLDYPRPDAWCGQCNQIMLTEGGWNNRSEEFARITLLCAQCYDQARERNQIKLKEEEFAALIEESYKYLELQMQLVESEYKISNYERFDYDDDTGEIVFSDQRIPRVIARYQNVGSISTRSNTWFWAWGNESISERTKEQVGLVRGFGETHNIERLTTANWEADEMDGWEMTAISANLLRAKFAYRVPVNHLYIFMIFKELRWADQQ